LGAAWKLSGRGPFDVTVLERNQAVGGNAGSFAFGGMNVDFGSHRLHPSSAEVILADLRAMLGPDLLDRPRHGRIRLRDRWVHFPLKPLDLFTNLPLGFTAGVMADSLIRLGSRKQGETFAEVLEQGLGRTICRDFYFPYARKIWGASPDELDREQARRRVAAGSLTKLVKKVLGAVPGFRAKTGQRFFYPRGGYGDISKAYASAAKQSGAAIRLGTTVTGIEVRENRAVAVHFQDEQGIHGLPARQILSTIPVSHLVRSIVPEAPDDVLKAACELKFRGMILIYLSIEADQFTEFDAHYFPGADVPITRLSEPKHYGLARLPGSTVLCAELPCSPEDPIWRSSDRELADIVKQSLATSGLPTGFRVLGIASRRLPQAYPIYTRDYSERFDLIDRWLGGIDGLVTFGRQGLFAHDNTHHTLAMAYALNDCLSDAGALNRGRWTEYRRAFREHIVED